MSRAPLLCLGVALGCATVTQEDPPSRLQSSASPSGAGGLSARGGSGNDITPLAGGSPNASGSGSSDGSGGSSSISQGGGEPNDDMAGGSGGTGGSGGVLDAPDAAPPFPVGTLLLEEDFEDFDAAAEGWVTTEDSAWAITTDPDTNSSVYAQTETQNSRRHLAFAGDPSWTNVLVEVDFKVLEFNGSSSSYLAGVCVRVEDEDNFYFIGLRSDNDRFGLRRFEGGGSNVTQSDFEEGATGAWYRLRVQVNGSTISALLDGPGIEGESLFSTTDTAYPAGAVGVCTVRASAVFDNLRVTAL